MTRPSTPEQIETINREMSGRKVQINFESRQPANLSDTSDSVPARAPSIPALDVCLSPEGASFVEADSGKPATIEMSRLIQFSYETPESQRPPKKSGHFGLGIFLLGFLGGAGLGAVAGHANADPTGGFACCGGLIALDATLDALVGMLVGGAIANSIENQDRLTILNFR